MKFPLAYHTSTGFRMRYDSYLYDSQVSHNLTDSICDFSDFFSIGSAAPPGGQLYMIFPLEPDTSIGFRMRYDSYLYDSQVSHNLTDSICDFSDIFRFSAHAKLPTSRKLCQWYINGYFTHYEQARKKIVIFGQKILDFAIANFQNFIESPLFFASIEFSYFFTGH